MLLALVVVVVVVLGVSARHMRGSKKMPVPASFSAHPQQLSWPAG